MFHATIGVFGNAGFAKKLGKQGTVNDIAIYNHGSSEGVFTYVTVNSDKIQPLLQVINMIDIPVLAISELNATVGEQIVAVSEFGFGHGFLMFDGVSGEQVKPLIKGTCVEDFSVVKDSIELVEAIKKLNLQRPPGELLILVDNYFDVKGVGTVVLGIIKSGSVKKYDKAIIEPIGKEIMIKGIQSQDKDIEVAETGVRVGLNIKGVETDEIRRGYVLGRVMKAKSLRLRFEKSRYSKEAIKENDPVFVSSMLQVVPGKVRSVGGLLELELEHQIVYTKDTKFLIASTKQVMPRIMGRAFLD